MIPITGTKSDATCATENYLAKRKSTETHT